MMRELNPELKTNDRVICLNMDGEIAVPMGTKGTVSHVGNDPFENDGKIISVLWDNSSTLSLISSTDKWIKDVEKPIKEEIKPKKDTLSPHYNFLANNPEIFKEFDYKFLKSFLHKMRETGIINMFAASPLLYVGKEFIDRHYGDKDFDYKSQESFDELLEMADEAKDKMVQGTIKYLESKGIEVTVENANKYVRKMAEKILNLYMTFFNLN